MSTVCSTWMRQPVCSGGHRGRTSIAMLCHDASKSLCPSNRLEIPALPLQGSIFKNGVRFSVQTTSPGSTPCRRCRLPGSAWSPTGSNVTAGRVVLVESMKFNEAQKRPERDCVRVIHFANALLDETMISHKFAHTISIFEETHSSSVAASIHAHSSTPVAPSLNPSQGRAPQLSSSHRPVVNRR